MCFFKSKTILVLLMGLAIFTGLCAKPFPQHKAKKQKLKPDAVNGEHKLIMELLEDSEKPNYKLLATKISLSVVGVLTIVLICFLVRLKRPVKVFVNNIKIDSVTTYFEWLQYRLYKPYPADASVVVIV